MRPKAGGFTAARPGSDWGERWSPGSAQSARIYPPQAQVAGEGDGTFLPEDGMCSLECGGLAA